MKKLPVALIALLLAFVSHSQTPPGLPEESTPVDFSNWADVLFFIVIPVAMVVIYLVMRKQRRREE